jgi:DNA-directed RNA polymerase beta subunit
MPQLTPILTDAESLRRRVHDKVTRAITTSFPIDLKGRTLEVKNVHVLAQEYSPEDQKRALMTGDSLHEVVKGTVVLKDAAGKVVDEAKNFTLTHVPFFTERHTIITDGNEYQIANMLRRKPGVYTQRRTSGELHSTFNLSKGSNFDLSMNPAKGTVYMQYGASHIPLYPVLRELGVPHEDIAKHLGTGIADANRIEHGHQGEAAISKLYAKLIHESVMDPKAAHAVKLQEVRKKLDLTAMNPDVTHDTLGVRHDKVTPLALLDASRKLLRVHDGHEEVDDADSLAYKTFHSVDDYLAERIKLTARAWAPKVRLALNGRDAIRPHLKSAPFSDAVRSFLSTSPLTAVPTGINPIELIDHAQKVTALGEGGIPSERAIPFEARLTHATHFGVLDPIRTPESGHAGVDIRASIAAHRDDEGNLYTPLLNVRTGKQEFVRAGDIVKHVIAFPHQEMKGEVDALVKGRAQKVPASRVEYQQIHMSHTYSPATTLIPMLPNIQGNRAIMGSKMQTQGVPLLKREAPLVQVASQDPHQSFETLYGRMICPRATASGTVEKIENGWIYIKPSMVKTEKRAAVEVDRKAVLITGNPKFIQNNPAADDFYHQIENHLGSLGYDVTRDAGEPHTSPPPADLYVTHSRGADRLRFVAPSARSVMFGSHREGAINHPEDRPKEGLLHETPHPSHYVFTNEMRAALDRAGSETDGDAKLAAAAKDDEDLVKVPYQTLFPFPSKTHLHHELSVKKGDKVVEGQRLGDSNFTRDGVLATGMNLRTAYVPYYGLNSNDAVVISQGCAKKLTSEHAYREVFPLASGVELSRDRHKAFFGAKYAPAQYAALGPDGVVRKGARVNPHDILVAGMTKNVLMGTDAMLGKISKALTKPYREVSLSWEHSTPGEVIEVIRTGNQIAVLVRTHEEMQVGDKLCYDAETEVLTACGWKFFTELTATDRVASLDEGRLMFVEPEAYHRYGSGGRMYEIKTQQLDLFVTSHHGMYVQRRGQTSFALHPAEEIAGQRVRYKKDAEWRGATPSHVVFPPLRVTAGQGGHGTRMIPALRMRTSVYAMLLGAYLSEGNIVDQPKSGSYGIDITQIKEPHRAQLLAELRRLGLKFNEHGRKTKVRLYSKQLLEHFRQFGKAEDKYIPLEVFNWGRETLRTIFDWLVWGDGSAINGRPVSYTTTSARLADDVQRLCLHVGYAGNIKRRHTPRQDIKGKTYDCRPCYSVRIITTKLRPQVNHGHVKAQNEQHEGFVDGYENPVFCVTVPSGVIYVRRNGKAVWSGNSGRYGNKGVVAKIIPDHEMLQDESGRPIDLLLTSAGVVSRINPGQITEAAAGKVAEKLGKPIVFDNASKEDTVQWAENLLKKHGVKLQEKLYDPLHKRHIVGPDGEGVTVGRSYIFKLFKMTDTNFSGHGVGPYDINEQPLKGGGDEAAKGLGKMEVDALLAHNARNILNEAATIRGQKNDQFWKAVQLGIAMPAPKTSFAFNKFTTMLEGAGVKVDKRGSKFKLLPLTDADVLKRSRGPLENAKTLVAKNLKPEKGGLFDLGLTGGPQGTLYSHIDLHEAVPNPVFEEPVRRLLGMTEKVYRDTLRERGGQYLHGELAKIDVPKKIAELRAKMRLVSGSDLNNVVKQIKYLEALQSEGLKPHDAYIIKKIPVIPPVFRPVTQQPNDPSRLMVADANKLYGHLWDANETLKGTVLDSDKGLHREKLYNAVASVYGTEDVDNEKLMGQRVKGFIASIAGQGSPKSGFFQRKLMKRQQDVSGRGTAVPDGNLNMDEVGIPEDMLWQMLDKILVARLIRTGYSPLAAREAVDKRVPYARTALMQEIKERPAMINRAPTLHRFGFVAAWAQPVQGKTIRVNPFVEKGLNLDYDGDTLQVHMPVTPGGIADAKQMTLSNLLLSDQSRNKLLAFPQHEAIIGVTHAANTKVDAKKPVKVFDSADAVKAAYRAGTLKLDDVIEVRSTKKADEEPDVTREAPVGLVFYRPEDVTGVEDDA